MADLYLRVLSALHNANCKNCIDSPTHFAAEWAPEADAVLGLFNIWLNEQADAAEPVGLVATAFRHAAHKVDEIRRRAYLQAHKDDVVEDSGVAIEPWHGGHRD